MLYMDAKKIALALAASIALIGCEPAEQAKKENMLSSELATAAKQKDPLQAFQTVQAVKSKLCMSGNCSDNPMWVKAGEDEVKYLTATIKQGNSKAFAALYGPAHGNSAPSIEQVRSQPGSSSSFLAHADRLAGTTPDEGLLLLYAGMMVMEGKHAVKDTTKAENFLARAWAAGNPNAPNIASRLYIKNNDYRNAYLWSLRCTDKCERDGEAVLDTLQQRLSPEAIKQAERAAQDTSIIELAVGG
jgi:hypothetical protein